MPLAVFWEMFSEKNGYQEKFSTGLLTSSSNIGLLFAPSLAIIVYGTVAQVRIDHLFLAGIVPGFLMLLIFSIFGIVFSLRRKIEVAKFDWRQALSALQDGWLEFFFPIFIIVSFLGGPHWIITAIICLSLTAFIAYRKKWRQLLAIPVIAIAFTVKPTLVEISALTVLYTVIVEIFIYREITARALMNVILKCLSIVGGVLIILASARAFSFFIIDAQIPTLLRDWIQVTIDSRLVFLLILNVILLLTGCIMDIFSAILVVVPLITPLGMLFGIDPIHLGMIFLANLGVGFITPPVGIDLFLASYRFEKPLPFIYRSVAPFFLIQIIAVLIITYIPEISLFLVRLVQ